MKKKWKMLFIMLVGLSMLIVACSEKQPNSGDGGKGEQIEDQTQPEGNGDQGEGNEDSAFKLDEPVTVTMMTMAPEFTNDLMVYKNIFEATNVRIDGQLPAGNYNDAVALTMAGGDIPDIIFLNGNKPPKNYGGQGALLDFNEHLDKMPNLKKFWDERPDLKQRATTHDGKTFQTVTDGLAYTNHLVWMYREDIFEQHDIEVPTTWDELYEVLVELKQLYPNSHPLTFRDAFGTVDGRMLQSFGITDRVHPALDTREAIYGQAENEYYSLLEYLHTFYKERLINQDFLSITAEQWVEIMTTGRAFITIDYIGRIQTLTDAMDEEGAQLALMAPPKGNDGPAYLRNMNYMPGGFSVYSQTSNLDATLHYIDFLFSDEGSDLVSWGKEGETFDYIDGERQLIVAEDTLSLRNETGMAGFGSYGKFDSEATMTLLPAEYRPYYEEVLPYIYPEEVIPAFTEEEEDYLTMTEEQITKHKDTMASRFIIGDRPLSEWDKYVEELNKLGLPKVLETYNAAFERMNLN